MAQHINQQEIDLQILPITDDQVKLVDKVSGNIKFIGSIQGAIDVAFDMANGFEPPF